MSQTILKDIREATFRANPDYELVTLDQLSAAQQSYLSAVTEQPDFYALLRPRRKEDLMIKSVGREVAQLFSALQEPNFLPPFAQEELSLATDPNRTLAELVLDGVLEINADEGFVSGTAAYSAVYIAKSAPTASGTLATLSLRALQHTQALSHQDTAALALYLYNYNRLPLSPYWHSRLPSADAVAAYLGIDAKTPTSRKLRNAWVQNRNGNANEESGWRFWTNKACRAATRQDQPIYKLYLSPLPRHLPEVFAAAVEVFTAHEVQHFKVGKDTYGILRPDKLIAYVSNADALSEVAERLRERLAGIPAHGVPFTAEVGLDGLLSWGIDPPSTEQSTAWKQRESWRLWIANRLAIVIAEARSQHGSGLEPWQFAFERIRLDYIDPVTWTPIDNLWQEYLTTPEQECLS